MISKNFYWWIVCIIAGVAVFVNLIVEQFFVALLMAIMFYIAAINYYKYRVKGE